MSRFNMLAKAILILLLLAAGCTPSPDAKSTPGTTDPPVVVERMVQSVSLGGWVYLSEPQAGVAKIAVTEQTQVTDPKGNPVSFCEIRAGQSIQAAGETRGSALVATQIAIQVSPALHGRGEPALNATLEMPSRLTNGETVLLEFTLTNNSEVGLYVLKWYTPLEGGFGGAIFCIERDGQFIPYKGPEAERTDPTPDSYVFLEAGASVSATIDLAEVYDFSKPGLYTIAFGSPRMSHVSRTVGEMATSIDDLGPLAMPSNQVSVTILEHL